MTKFPKKYWDKMTTNITKSFNAWLREECQQIIYSLLLIRMHKLVAMLDNYISEIENWKSLVGPKTNEKLMLNIMTFGLIIVIPYLGRGI